MPTTLNMDYNGVDIKFNLYTSEYFFLTDGSPVSRYTSSLQPIKQIQIFFFLKENSYQAYFDWYDRNKEELITLGFSPITEPTRNRYLQYTDPPLVFWIPGRTIDVNSDSFTDFVESLESRGRTEFSLFNATDNRYTTSNVKLQYDYHEYELGKFYIRLSYNTPEIRRGRTDSSVYEWNYRPTFEFFNEKNTKNSTYFGLELEVCTDINPGELMKVMTEVEPKQEPFMYPKRDSSISGNHRYKYELVTHPMSPRRMRREFRTLYSKLHSLLVAQGKTIEDVFTMNVLTNGLHIHVSRSAFNTPLDSFSRSKSKSFRMAKFAYLWNNGNKSNAEFISKLAKRDVINAQFSHSSRDHTGRTLGWSLNNMDPSERYVCCNTRNSETLEVRVFQGNPTLQNILYCIDAVESMLVFSLESSYSRINFNLESLFKQWLIEQKRFSTLRKEILCA